MSSIFLISRLGIHAAQAERRQRNDVGALHGLRDHRLDGLRYLGIGDRLDEMRFRAEQEVHRHHAGLRRQRRGVGGGGNAEFDVARFHQLQDLRLLPELRAGILIDQHGALAQVLELVGEDIAEDAVSGRLRLIIGEAVMLDFLRRRAGAVMIADAAAIAARMPFSLRIVSPFDVLYFLRSSHWGCSKVNKTKGGNAIARGRLPIGLFRNCSRMEPGVVRTFAENQRFRLRLAPTWHHAYFPLARMKSKSQPSSACRMVSLNRCA